MHRTVRSLFSPATLLLLPTCCILFIVSGILTGCGKPAPEQEKPAEKSASSEVVAEKKEPPAEPAEPAKPTEPAEPAEQAKPEASKQAKPAEKPASSEVVAEKKAPPAEPAKPEENKIAALSPARGSALRLSPGQEQAARVTRDFAFLGVFTEAIDKEKSDSGLQIIYVYPGSAGNDMGLMEGDQIIALNDFVIPNRDRFVKELRKENIGATIRFRISRDGKKLKLKGKIKSYKKTMGMIQDRLRTKYVGKPLETLPKTLWWNPKTAKFEPAENPLGAFKDKIGLLVAYDDCPGCQKNRVDFLAQLFLRTMGAGGTLPLAFAGIYQSDTQLNKGGSKECLTQAIKLYATKKPPFPAGIAHFPDGSPAPKDREKSLYLHNHGVVITGPDGKVAYLQVTGYPDQVAIQKTIGELFVKHFQPPK
ncbi:MAG: PDZ domain-containing protein, partial [Planctomycetota bacterium]